MQHLSEASRGPAIDEARDRGYRIADGNSEMDRFQQAFDEAAANNPDAVAELTFRMGGRPARLRCVGEKLAGYVRRPLSHLETPIPAGETPALTIDLWDEGETGVTCDGCANADELGVDGIITSSEDGRYLGYRRARSMTMYDRANGRFVGWSNYEDRACLYEMGRPLHVPLSFWHDDIGLQIMHSGLVADGDVGVLFPGMGGSGKSTSSLTCLEAGLEYLGDDYIGLSTTDDGTFVGHSVYNSSHLEPHHLQRFERLRNIATAPIVDGEDKSLVLLDEVYPGRFRHEVPIRAIALPRVVDAEETRAVPTSKAEALLALAPSSIVMIPGKGRAGMGKLGDLVANVACYRLELGRRLESIPEAVRKIAEEIRG